MLKKVSDGAGHGGLTAPLANRQSLEELKRPWRLFVEKRRLHVSATREAIVDAFLKSGTHLDLHELLRLARRKSPRVGLSTVYRTVKLLQEAGLADERNFGLGAALYEATAGKDHHDHLVCQHCGRILEFVNEQIEALQREVANAHAFRLVRHRHELYGLCSTCQSQEAAGE